MSLKVFSWKRIALILAVIQVLILWSAYTRQSWESVVIHRPLMGDDTNQVLTESSVVGMLVALSGEDTSLPEGWLPCVGQSLSKAEHQELYAAVGDAYARTNVPPDHFRLPDFSGAFALTVDPEVYPWFYRYLPGGPMAHGNLILGKAHLLTSNRGSGAFSARQLVWVVKAR